MEQKLFSSTQGRLGDGSEAIAVPGMFHMFVFLFLMDNTLKTHFFFVLFVYNTISVENEGGWGERNETDHEKKTQRELTAHLEV